jgi:alkyl hydroperoxide reductase subunit AhpF
MKWLEIIELRSVGSNRKILESQLQNLVNKVNKASKHKTIKIYNHTTVETDFSIHIFHDSKKVENSGSPLGLHLSSALRVFGLINHSVWFEMYSK